MNQWLINILITGPQYVSRLTMCYCLNVKYTISGVYRHSLAQRWQLVKVPKNSQKGLWHQVCEPGKTNVQFPFHLILKRKGFVPLTQKCPQTSQALLPDNIYNPVCVCILPNQPLKHPQCTAAAVLMYWIHCPNPPAPYCPLTAVPH